MVLARRLGYGDDIRMAQHPRQRDLRRRRAARLRNACDSAVLSERSLVDRTVGHRREAVRLLPWQQVELDATPARRVVDLVRGTARAGGHAPQFLQVVDIEVRHAPMGDVSAIKQRFEAADGRGERMAAAPVQQVQVDAIEAQAAPAAVTGLCDTARTGMVRIDLGDDKDLLASHDAGGNRLGQRLSHDLLGATLAVHLGGIDQAVAQFERAPDRGDLRAARRCGLTEPPRAEAEGGNICDTSGQANRVHRSVAGSSGCIAQAGGRRGTGLPRSSSAMRRRYAANSGSSPFSSLGSRW